MVLGKLEIYDWRWLPATPLKWENFSWSRSMRSWISKSTKYGHACMVFPQLTLPLCCCTSTLRERWSGRLSRRPRMRRRLPFLKRKRSQLSSPTPSTMLHSSKQTVMCHQKRGLSMSPFLVMMWSTYLKPEMMALRMLRIRKFCARMGAWMRSSSTIQKMQWSLISLKSSMKSS